MSRSTIVQMLLAVPALSDVQTQLSGTAIAAPSMSGSTSPTPTPTPPALPADYDESGGSRISYFQFDERRGGAGIAVGISRPPQIAG